MWFFRVFGRGQNNCYFDSAVKNTNMPQNKILQHRFVLTATVRATTCTDVMRSYPEVPQSCFCPQLRPLSAFLVGVQKQSTKLEFLLTLSRSFVPFGEENKK